MWIISTHLERLQPAEGGVTQQYAMLGQSHPYRFSSPVSISLYSFLRVGWMGWLGEHLNEEAGRLPANSSKVCLN